jgi:hypothetical protein
MTLAADFSWTHPDPAELVANNISDCLLYCGPAMPDNGYIQQLLAAGLSVTFIEETRQDPYVGGYDAGVARVRYAEGRVVAAGYPADCTIVYVLSDQNVAMPGAAQEAMVADHARGIDDATTRPAWMGYGNRTAIDAARTTSPKMLYSWVPATWRYDATDTLVQQIGSPINGTDVNVIQTPNWGQWGGSSPGPAPASPEVAEMFIAVGRTIYGVAVAFLVSGGRTFRTFDGAEGGYGIPQSALDWKAQPGRDGVPYIFVDADTLGQMAAPWPTKQTVTPVPPVVTPPVPTPKPLPKPTPKHKLSRP